MEKYDRLFLDTEKMSYFSVSVSVFPYFSNDNMCQLSANCFALLRLFALIWHFSCFGKVAKFRVGHGHGLAQVFHFSWVLEQSQEKLKTMLIQNLGGQISCIMGDVQVANGKATISTISV